jgi:quinol-cytochrome oxidoreductase complex cytochrome b subunit
MGEYLDMFMQMEFFFLYCCLFPYFRGFCHGSYARPRQGLLCSGLVIFILIIATAFLGYVLPWGQISFWGATVITNLFSAIPLIVTKIVRWVQEGFSVDNATLNRFFSLHYILPFIHTGKTQNATFRPIYKIGFWL